MTTELANLFWYANIFVILILITGIYCILASFNLMRALIGAEILIKAVTLFVILAGYCSNQIALAQALVITIIVIEVVVMVVAGGIIFCVFQFYKTIDTRKLANLKG